MVKNEWLPFEQMEPQVFEGQIDKTQKRLGNNYNLTFFQALSQRYKKVHGQTACSDSRYHITMLKNYLHISRNQLVVS